MPEVRKCQICGIEYVGDKRFRYCRTCAKKKADAEHRKRNRERYHELLAKGLCPFCLKPLDREAVICSKCREKRQRQREADKEFFEKYGINEWNLKQHRRSVKDAEKKSSKDGNTAMNADMK